MAQDKEALRLSFTVYGNPIPWRRARRRGDRYFVHARVEEWQEVAIGGFLAEFPLLSYPVFPKEDIGITLLFFRGDKRRCDLDNLEKSLMDAWQSYIWTNDYQVKVKHSGLFYDKENPRVQVEVWPLQAE